MSEQVVLKWQPAMLVLTERLECKCGVLAIFVVLTESDEENAEGKRDMDYTGLCQQCFAKAQKEEEDDEEVS